MNIQIDTKNKTIVLKSAILIKDLIEELKLMNIDLNEYSVSVDIIYNNYNFQTAPFYQYYNQPIGVPNQYTINC